MPELSLFDLTGRKALVTGGAQGIGRACAHALAMGGADVAIVDMNETTANKAVAAIRAMGRDSMFVRCDVTQADQIQGMVETVVERFGRLDIAVNNAGIWRPGEDENQAKEDWDRVIGVNLTGAWLCARAAMLQMIRQPVVEGKIINVASIMACTTGSNGSYNASKAGLVHLTRTLAAKWGRYNINVNCISPSHVAVAMGAQRTDAVREQIRAFTPLGHVQRLADFYGPVLFLASKASDYVTGQNLIVDGGHTLDSWMQPLERSVPPRVDPAGEVEDDA